jgi:hypothetical protein
MFLVQDLKDKTDVILDNLSNNSIDKAILLEMGQPKFLLIDFQKYEKMFLDYQVLKKNQVGTTNSISQQQDNNKNEEIIAGEIKDIKKEHFKEELKSIESIVTVENKVNDIYFPTAGVESSPDNDSDSNSQEEEKVEIDEYEISEEDEIKQALEKIKSINFDDNMRRIAESKIREKILKARKERFAKKRELEMKEEATLIDTDEEIENNTHYQVEEPEEENQAPILDEFASLIGESQGEEKVLNEIKTENLDDFKDENLENNIKQKRSKALNDFWD